jgi:hypothetical protein
VKLNLVGHLVLERIRKKRARNFCLLSLRIIEKLFESEEPKKLCELGC